MAKLLNKNGTSAIDELTYDKNASSKVIYHTQAGDDKVTITGGSVSLVNDKGNDTIKITGGSMHSISGTGTTIENITINGAASVEGSLGDGKDVVVLSNSDGRKTTGGASAIRGGGWTDTFTVNAGVKYYQLYGESGNDVFNVNGGSGINFWGGANNDTFIVKGGTNNKLYGGDSSDLFEINAAKQNMILGYGNDIVNINAGDEQQIKCNLGINTINLLAGSGHVLTADIDQAASKIVGADVGYGQDRVLIDGATQVTTSLGDGRDTVEIKTGSGHNINTDGWTDTVTIHAGVSSSTINLGRGDDIINIEGGKDITIIGGDGADTYNIDWEKLEGKLILDRDADYKNYESDINNVININAKLESFKRGTEKGVLTLYEAGTEKAITAKDKSYTFAFTDATKTYEELCNALEVSYRVEKGETRAVEVDMDMAEIYVEGGHATSIKTGNQNDYLEINSGLAENVDLGAGKNIIVVNGGELKGVTCSQGDRITINGGIVEDVNLGKGNLILNGGEFKGLLYKGGETITINGGSFTYKGEDESAQYEDTKSSNRRTYYINGGTKLELLSPNVQENELYLVDGHNYDIRYYSNEYHIDCSTFTGDIFIHRPYSIMSTIVYEALSYHEAATMDSIYLQNAVSSDFTYSWDPQTAIFTMTNGKCTISLDNYMYNGYYSEIEYGYLKDSGLPELIFADKTVKLTDLYVSVFDSGHIDSYLGSAGRDQIVVDGADVGEINMLEGPDKLTMRSGHIGSVLGSDFMEPYEYEPWNGPESPKLYFQDCKNRINLEMTGGTIDNVFGRGILKMTGGSIENLTWTNGITMEGGSIGTLCIKENMRNANLALKGGKIGKLVFDIQPINVSIGKDIVLAEFNGSVAGDTLSDSSTNAMVAHLQEGNDTVYAYGNSSTYYGDAGNDRITLNGNGNIGYGGEGTDTITVGGVSNIGYGDGGEDTFLLTGNKATAVGGAGTDKYLVTWLSADGMQVIDNSTAGARDLDVIVVDGLSFAEAQRSWDASAKILKLSKGSSSLYLKGITENNVDYVKFSDGVKYYFNLVSGATASTGLLAEIEAASLTMAMEGVGDSTSAMLASEEEKLLKVTGNN